jgi:putative FmdB family regulatory protein
MPTYEYRCEKCNQTFDAFQSMKDDAFTVCPKQLCRLATWGEGKVKRLVGMGAGLIFKGSGFYTTDYRSSNYKESAKKESDSGKSDSGKSDGAKAGSEKGGGSTGTSGSTGGSGSTGQTSSTEN